MLSALNERVIYNDGKPVHIPLKMMIAASNEMPAEGEGLEALHDRILVKWWVDYIKDMNNRFTMMRTYNELKDPYNVANQAPRTTISLEDLELVQYYCNAISLSKTAMTAYGKLLATLNKKQIIVSDRKANWCLDIIKASALLHGRTVANEDDIKALIPVLWEKQEDIPTITTEIMKLVDPYSDKALELFNAGKDILDEIVTLKAQDDLESRKLVMEKMAEGKNNVETIIKKINNVIKEASRKQKDVSKFTEYVNTLQTNLSNLLQALFNITPSIISQAPDLNTADVTDNSNYFNDEIPF